MELRQLLYFVEISKLKSFTKASQKLNISQPALSKCVKNLENELGMELFIRSPGKIQLTQSGEEVLKNAQDLKQYYENIQRNLLCIKNKSINTYALGYTSFLSNCCDIHKTVEIFRAQGIENIALYEGQQNELIPALIDSKLDSVICLVYNNIPIMPEQINTTTIYTGRIMRISPSSKCSGNRKSEAIVPHFLHDAVSDPADYKIFTDHLDSILMGIKSNNAYSLLPDLCSTYCSHPDFYRIEKLSKPYHIVFIHKKQNNCGQLNKKLYKYFFRIFTLGLNDIP